MIVWIVGTLIALELLIIFYALFCCKHAWEFVDKTEFPAPIEIAAKNGVSSLALWASDIKEMSRKTAVIVLRCPKCGKAKILRENH